jgi:hypothetical protein
MPKRKRNFRKKRPIAVSVIAMGIVVLFSIRLYQVIDPLIRSNVFANGVEDPLLIGWQLTSLGAMLLTSASYLLLSWRGSSPVRFPRLRRWSWLVLMAWTGNSLAISLIEYFYGHTNYAVMASNVIIAFALNMNEVQQIFGIRRVDESNP